MIFDCGALFENNNAKAVLVSSFISLLIALFHSFSFSPNFSMRFPSFTKEVSGEPRKINFASSPKTVPSGLIVKRYSSLGVIGEIGQGIGSFIFLSKLEFLDHNIFPFFEIVISFKGSGEKISGWSIEVSVIWVEVELSNKILGVNKHRLSVFSLSIPLVALVISIWLIWIDAIFPNSFGLKTEGPNIIIPAAAIVIDIFLLEKPIFSNI